MKPGVIAAKMETRDVMGDCLGGNGERQAEESDEGNGGKNVTVFAGVAAELRADNKLKTPMDSKGQEIGGRENDAAPQKLTGLRAGWLVVGLRLAVHQGGDFLGRRPVPQA